MSLHPQGDPKFDQVANIILALSSHGRVAYTSYWTKTLARTILEWPEKKLTITDLHDETSIAVDDLNNTLSAMGVLEQKKKGFAINKRRAQAWAQINNINFSNPIDPDAFVQKTDDEDAKGTEEDESE